MKILFFGFSLIFSTLSSQALEPGRYHISCVEAYFEGARRPYRGYILTKSADGKFELKIGTHEQAAKGSVPKVTSVQVVEDDKSNAFLLTAHFEESISAPSKSEKPNTVKGALALAFEAKGDGDGTGTEVSLFRGGRTTFILAKMSRVIPNKE